MFLSYFLVYSEDHQRVLVSDLTCQWALSNIDTVFYFFV